MPITTLARKNKVTPEPSVTDQLIEAELDAANALSVFTLAAEELHLASLKQDALAGLLYDQIEALEAQALAALNASVDNAAAVLRIRDFLGNVA